MKRLRPQDAQHMTEVQLFRMLDSELVRIRDHHMQGWTGREVEKAADRAIIYLRELRKRDAQGLLF